MRLFLPVVVAVLLLRLLSTQTIVRVGHRLRGPGLVSSAGGGGSSPGAGMMFGSAFLR